MVLEFLVLHGQSHIAWQKTPLHSQTLCFYSKHLFVENISQLKVWSAVQPVSPLPIKASSLPKRAQLKPKLMVAM